MTRSPEKNSKNCDFSNATYAYAQKEISNNASMLVFRIGPAPSTNRFVSDLRVTGLGRRAPSQIPSLEYPRGRPSGSGPLHSGSRPLQLWPERSSVTGSWRAACGGLLEAPCRAFGHTFASGGDWLASRMISWADDLWDNEEAPFSNSCWREQGCGFVWGCRRSPGITLH
jgi:hypothetical protein